MNDLCTDIGFRSINHVDEQLCGDHVDIIDQDDSQVIVLADGLGSGVKASILSTLTARIISTMLAQGLSIEECVSTVAATLPVCNTRGVAYSTFTILHVVKNQWIEIIQYDNPDVIFLRDGKNTPYDKRETLIGGKKIYFSSIRLQEGDVFVAMSDGCPHAGIGMAYNFGWRREEIASFMETFADVGYTARTLATILTEECDRLYGHKPGDDATACVLRIRKRNPVNMLFGPPSDRNDADRMMALFFAKEGKHIVCGGTTSSIAAKYLNKPLVPSLNFADRNVPPTAQLEGVDLVTEGVITVNKVVEYAEDYLGENTAYETWGKQRDGASLLCRLLFEEATDINFYVGKAINPAHQNPDLPINFNIKMNLVQELSKHLQQMGKRVNLSYF